MNPKSNELDSVRRQFGRVASEYVTSVYHSSGPDLIPLVKAAQPTTTDLVLDIGCGTGHTALALAPHCSEVVACDVTEAMLHQTSKLADKRGHVNVRTRLADATALPFANNTFDIVACRVAAHHFADVPAAIKEFSRVLAPEGRLVVSDSYAPSEPNGTDETLNKLERLRDASHGRNHRIEEWTAMLQKESLSSHLVDTWDVRQDFDEWVRRMRTPAHSITALKKAIDETAAPIRKRLGIVGNAYDLNIPIALILAQPRG